MAAQPARPYHLPLSAGTAARLLSRLRSRDYAGLARELATTDRSLEEAVLEVSRELEALDVLLKTSKRIRSILPKLATDAPAPPELDAPRAVLKALAGH